MRSKKPENRLNNQSTRPASLGGLTDCTPSANLPPFSGRMAKQRRLPTRSSAKPQPQSTATRAAVRGTEPAVAPVRPAQPAPPAAPPRRETYFEAVAVYERAVE